MGTRGGWNPMVSHRGMWYECKYWKRSNFNGTVSDDKLVYDTQPSGFFWCDEVGDYDNADTSVGPVVFSVNRTSVRTNDQIDDLQAKDLVAFNGNIWKVVDVRKTRMRKFDQCCVDGSLFQYTVYLTR